MSFVYILECADGTLYTGWSVDPQARLLRHNNGTGAKYTRSKRPTRLVYCEEQPDRAAALRRECEIKKLTRAQKLALVEGRAADASSGRNN